MEKNIDYDNKEIGQRIREERNKIGLSRGEFAEILELSDYYVGQLERGERQMSLPVLIKVANSLHITLDYLVFGKVALYSHSTQEINNSDENLNNVDSYSAIINLLNKCSHKELELVKKLISTILPYLNNK